MNSVFLFILLFLFTVSIIPLFFIIRLSRYIHLWTAQTKTTNAKKHVTIIIPTCGKTYNLKNNLDRVINNSYENSRTILTTTQDDLSKEILFELQTQYPDKVRVTLATKSYGNAQKLKNQLTALETIKEQTDYLVFIDADGLIDSQFIERLIKPLETSDIGIATGWRWYIPKKLNLAAHTQILWNASAIPFIIDPTQGLVFGGAMAVRYCDFIEYKIPNLWENSISDSLSMANCFKQNNKKSIFVPDCIALSHGETSFKNLISWTNRQTTISRVYMPKFWRTTALSYLFSFCLLVFTITLGCKLYGIIGCIPPLFLYWIPLYLNSIFIKNTMKSSFAFTNHEIKKSEHLIDIIACLTATVTYGINIIRSIILKTIIWSTIKYKLISPYKTLVYREKD